MREQNSASIRQRVSDGYFDATGMRPAYGKVFANYSQTAGTQEVWAEIASNIGIQIFELVENAYFACAPRAT